MNKPLVICEKWQARFATALLCTLLLCGNAHAATFTVDRTDDAVVSTCSAAPNDCTLRGAITKANATAPDDASDTINFDSSVFSTAKTILLNTALDNVADDVAFTGPAAGVTVDGVTKSFIIFSMNKGANVRFDNLTLRNGDQGIFNLGGTTVTRCILSNNNSGIVNDSSVNNRNTVVTVKDCTLSDNGFGIATNSGGTVTVIGCTFNGNQTGIFNDTSTVIKNCTLSGNTSYGLNNHAGTMNITNCTVTGNGVGLSNVTVAYLRNSLIVGNATNVSGVFSYNNNGPNLTTGTAADAGLDPAGLQDNGGPTKTIALLPGSVAIDAGSNALATDQRGVARPQGAASDIGAFEREPLATLSVNNPTSVAEGSADISGSIVFAITLNAPSTQTVTVKYHTRDGINNPATAGVDYQSVGGTLTFAPGITLKRVRVNFIGDDKAEAKETFFLDLYSPTNATLADSRGVGTIVNDDATPQLFEDEPSS